MDFVLSLVAEAVDPGPPYRCTVLGYPISQGGFKLLLVSVDPPFLDAGADIARSEIMFAQRIVVGEESLLERTAWPIYVYVLLPNDGRGPLLGRPLGAADYRNYQWGELYPPSALDELERIHTLPLAEIWAPLSALSTHEA